MTILDESVGQLARSIPGATAVFHKYQIDFCCNGKHSLREAAAARAQDAQSLAEELQALAPASEEPDATRLSDVELIEHILTRYHDVHRQQLPELIRLAQRVELVHAGHPECPSGLAAHLVAMQADLESHMRKEEQILFPMISRGMAGLAVQPVSMMRHEHLDHGQSLARIGQLTHGIGLPRGACNTWRALYVGLSALQTDLMDHIHLENNILFDRIDGNLGGAHHG